MNIQAIDDLPLILAPKDVQHFLGVGRGQAYKLFDSGKFHTFNVGRNKYVYRENFLNYIRGLKAV